VGIHWLLAPVADVNNNPANPVINTRSFGEDPERVARLVGAFVEGAHAARPPALTTAKHFPGHGDTAVDSHLELPVLTGDRQRLDQVELRPFRAAIAAGVDAVMLGHLEVPALDPSKAPATLSRPLAHDLLRGELGFQGVTVTDAMDMKGIASTWSGAAAAGALAAGADVVLMPPDVRVAVQSIVRAVREGELAVSRLDEAVRRVLTLKARLGLTSAAAARVDPLRVRDEVARAADQARADAIARAAVTLVRDEGGLVPLALEKPLRILHLVAASDWVGGAPGSVVDAELDARRVTRVTRRLAPRLSAEETDEILADAAKATHVLVSSHVRVSSSVGRIDMDPSFARLISRLATAGVPTIVASFGSPYVLSQFPEVSTYLCAWGPSSASQRAAVAALFGEGATSGKLPVSIATPSRTYAAGSGLERGARPLALVAVAPEEAGFTDVGLDGVRATLQGFVDRKAFPGAVIAVGHGGRLAMLEAFGRLTYEPQAPATSIDTIYDLASLTKVVGTTTMAMMMVDEGRLDLDRPVHAYLPAFAGSASKERVTVRQLLTHSSGIDWWAPLYQDTVGWDAAVKKIQAMELVYEPGTDTKYSDLGVILLGEILQRVSGRPLAEFERERIFDPLGMRDTGYLPRGRPGLDVATRVAPTELDAWRGRVLQGDVHDENAFAVGGVSAHAGLFGTAGDLARFAQMLLRRGVSGGGDGGGDGGGRLVSGETVDLFTRRDGAVPGSSRALGWDTKSTLGSSAGLAFSEQSFGHTGFTGTSIWIDPTRDLFVILLTNRVHPTRDNNLIREARPAVADAVVRALVDPTPHVVERSAVLPGTVSSAVRVGLDRVLHPDTPIAADVARWRSARLGLVAHGASVTADGRQAVDALRGAGFGLVRLFSPEHGLQGRAAAGENVDDSVDAKSGLPVVSLYGERWKPTGEDLQGLDALLFDLQDAGVRFYTYGSTLLGCLEAAKQAGIELVVLDRPDPLGGERVEGPVAAPRSVVRASVVNRLPGPLVHGLTLGEMARLLNAEIGARLTVVPMAGWRRSMVWTDTGRPWIPPSPNLRFADAALAYPGTALLEGSNVSEGRGNDAPFLLVGAPWLGELATPSSAEAKAWIESVGPTPGFRLAPARFTNRVSAAAPSPKHRDVESLGVRVEVTDPAKAEGYRLGIALARAFMRSPEFAWERDGASLTWLVGTPVALERLRGGGSVDAVVAADAADHAAWRERRRPFLLYD
jgi:beta-N-acetylhexosaminidase